MAAMVAKAAVRTHHNSVRMSLDDVKGRPLKVGIGSEPVPTAPNDKELSPKAAWAALVDEARIRAGEEPKEIYGNAGTDKGTYSEAMSENGRSNWAGHWLLSQSPRYKAAFHKILGRVWGLDEAAEIELDAERIAELVALLIKTRRVSK